MFICLYIFFYFNYYMNYIKSYNYIKVIINSVIKKYMFYTKDDNT